MSSLSDDLRASAREMLRLANLIDFHQSSTLVVCLHELAEMAEASARTLDHNPAAPTGSQRAAIERWCDTAQLAADLATTALADNASDVNQGRAS
jgi:hypothetical protein